MSRPRPLEGILVVAVEQAVAVPLATRRLADAGARVVKVERPGGDFARGYDTVVQGGSAYFVWLNRGKESVVVDLKDPEDKAFLHRLVDAADVFVQNMAPGAAERAGFGAAALRAAHPRLVTCGVSGYGGEGPYASMKAYDNLVQAEAGLQAVTGTPESPARVGISVCDIAAGMHAYGAVLEALLLRERTGEGADLRVSMFDALADWMAVPYLYTVHGGKAPARSGLSHPTIAPYGPFETGEGDVIIVAVQHDREWARLCADVLDERELARDPRFVDNPSRVANRPALRRAIQGVLGALSTADACARLDAAGMAFGRVNTVEAFARHPQLRLAPVDTEGGPVLLPAEPALWDGDGDGDDGSAPRVPALDEHGAALRAEFAAAEGVRR